MTEPIVKTAGPRKPEGPTPSGRPRPGLRANIEVRFAQKERVRQDRDRPKHMADVKIPGPG